MITSWVNLANAASGYCVNHVSECGGGGSLGYSVLTLQSLMLYWRPNGPLTVYGGSYINTFRANLANLASGYYVNVVSECVGGQFFEGKVSQPYKSALCYIGEQMVL